MKKLFNSFTILFSIALLFACGSKTEHKNEYQTLPVATLNLRDTVLQREYVSDIQAVRNVEIRSHVSGFIHKIYVDEGKTVQKGQILFEIKPEEFKAELAKATASLENAKAEAKAAELEVKRVQILVDKKVVAHTELEMAQAKLAAFHAKIEEARSEQAHATLRLSYTIIRSPFDGIVDRIPLKMGSRVEEGSLLTTVSDLSDVYAYFHVSENEYLEYRKTSLKNASEANNTSVQLILADGSQYGYAGKIETIDSEFENSTGSIAFRAKFPNPEKLLKHGATGKVLLANKIEDALMVPQKSVFEIQDKNYVFVLDAQNKVKMTNFIPKNRVSHYYIVESGLKPGEKIVYEGIQNIQDGSQIIPLNISPDSLIAELTEIN